MPKIFINDLNHYYEQAGEGASLVFIHGAFANANLWEPQWQYFSSQYRTLRYDLRGNGRTGASNQTHYTISTFAEDLIAMLDALQIKSPILCGLSMGGAIAQTYAVHNPESPRALILVSTSVSASLTRNEKLLHNVLMPEWAAQLAIRALGVKRFTRFSLWLAGHLWGKNWLGTRKDIRDYVEMCMLQVQDDEFMKIWEAIYSFDLLPLNQIVCPTLVLNGEYESASALRHTNEILRRVSYAEAKIIPMAGHAMNMENPEAYNRLVEAFLSKI